ncbi:unnamed protein product [Cylicostephanus goldi]|uniref:Uncharacterized protein n=1 Tax=Cylicostephanus goldi TaxID=71465 RepID=A0A3P7MKV8_CYLGO|nr:unnamed protein product [Cylicostephanus goldi]
MSTESDGSLGAGERIYLHIYDYETKEFSGLTTYHGLVRIYNSNTWPSRIFWCVVVLSCLSLFMIHSGYLLLGYHSKPTLFQVNTIVAPDGIKFPDITICNHNLVEASSLEGELSGFNMSSALFSYISTAFLDHFYDDDHVEKQNQFEKYLEDYVTNTGIDFSIAEFFHKIRPTCEDMVLSCSFAGEPIHNCCSYSEVVPTDIGYCIRFSNSKLNKTQILSGGSYGWQFILDGINAPDPILRYFRYSFPFLTNRELLTQLQYTSTHCEWNCLAHEWLYECECLPLNLLIMDEKNKFTICTPLQIRICSERIHGKYKANFFELIDNRKAQEFLYLGNLSDCNCDVECEKIEYDMQMSYSDVITESVTQRFVWLTNVTNNRSSYKLLIYFRILPEVWDCS